MRLRASAVSAEVGELSGADADKGCRATCLMNLICFRYRVHHAHTRRCSRSFSFSERPRRRSIDSDIKGTICWQGWSVRRSCRLIALLSLI